MKMDVVRSFETSVYIRNTRLYVSEDGNFQISFSYSQFLCESLLISQSAGELGYISINSLQHSLLEYIET
jgi:hypothetical protein